MFITNLNIFLIIAVLFLSLLIIFISKKGYCLRLKNYCVTSSYEEFIVLLLIISSIIIFILHISLIIFTTVLAFSLLGGGEWQLFILNNSDIFCMVNETNTNTQDPVRWWPSGTSQSWGILGTALGVYRLVPGSSRVKAIAALGSLGITIPSTVYFHAVENPNGFNRLMYSWMKYKQNGNWPSNIPNQVKDEDLKDIIPNLVSEGESKYGALSASNSQPSLSSREDTTVPITGELDLKGGGTSSFLPKDFNNLLDNLLPSSLKEGGNGPLGYWTNGDDLFSFILDFFRPVQVVGHLDDLIGQQLFIHLLLFIVVLSLLVLFTIYLFIQIMLNNKEFIKNKFKNRFVLFFIKYQLILANVSSVVLPLFIMVGIIELLVGLYFILTHPIPYEKLGIDLHMFITSDQESSALDTSPHLGSTDSPSPSQPKGLQPPPPQR